MKHSLCFVLAGLLLGVAAVSAAEIRQKWLYASTNLDVNENVEKMIKLMDDGKKAGITHLLLAESKTGRLNMVGERYFNNVKKFLDAAKERNIEVVVSVYPVGYGGSLLVHDGNMVAGVPARDVPFVVKTATAEPAPEPLPLKNGDFENADGDKLADWQQPAAGQATFVDKEVKHGGNASARIDVDKLPKDANGAARFVQTFKVTPFRHYRLSVWMKAENLKEADPEAFVVATSSDGKRRNTWTNLGVKENQDWTKHEIIFNTVEGTELRFDIGVSEAKGGKLWIDDLTIEPAGLMHILRREGTPLKVASEDGKTVYEEGKDFKPVFDPQVNQKPFGGEYFLDHATPKIELTDTSRIKDGQKLVVSYFHPVRIYSDQDVLTIEDPKVFQWMDEQMQRVSKAWPVSGYMMAQDEIRVGGWEPQTIEKKLTPGQVLARQTKFGYDLIRKYAPSAKVYAWSDMYTPHHNARPFSAKGYYYLANGNWDGSWEGLPKDVIVMNWYAPSPESMKWLADRGHAQVMCGYYDAGTTEGMKKNIKNWMTCSKGLPDILGLMYTTWSNNFKNMPEYFRLADEYPKWDSGADTEAPKDR